MQIKGSLNPDFDVFSRSLKQAEVLSDPIKWQEQQLGVTLYSNQIEVTDFMFDPLVRSFNILACRGAGKSIGIADAVAAYGSMFPGTTFIVAAPIEKQASRLIRHMKNAMISDRSKAANLLDVQSSSALRLLWKNGSMVVGVSGQEKASVEGEHGSVLIVDEAHLVPAYSMSQKLTPMIMAKDGVSKIIKLGVSMGRGHFYKSVMASKHNSICPWNKAEIYQATETINPLFYKGVQISRLLLARMPLEYKVIYFPDRPDLQVVTGEEISVLDWQTQYEMEWIEDINNLLSEKDQLMLSDGKHQILTQGYNNERYFAGLDTAPGSLTGRKDTDRTVLSIWRLRKDNSLEKVASFRWVGNILEQEEEIWEICNHKTGMFKCEVVFADYSNIALNMVERFRRSGMPIVGVTFGASAKSVGSNRNWKNTLYDNFLINLQSGKAKYPDIQKMKLDSINATPEVKTQVDNLLEDFSEWCAIQRTRGKGINDKIEAPTDTVEDDDGGRSRVLHDDACSADVLGVWAATHPAQMKKDMARAGGLIGYEIPIPVFGPAYSSRMTAGGQQGSPGMNPMAQQQYQTGPTTGPSMGGMQGDSAMNSPISSFINMNLKKP